METDNRKRDKMLLTLYSYEYYFTTLSSDIYSVLHLSLHQS